MFDDLLEIAGVQIARKVKTSNGMGGSTTATTLTTLAHNAGMWSPSQSQRYISDKMARTSTHILATRTGDYSFTVQDDSAIVLGKTYKINGPSDDIGLQGEITLTGLELIE